MPQFSFSEYELIRVEVFWVSLVGIWLLYSLLAFWVANRNWHWFLRVALLILVAAALKAIEAEDLMLMQLSNCMTVFVVTLIWKALPERNVPSVHSRDWNKQLSLANLMFTVALAALLLAIARPETKNLVAPSYSIGFGCAVGLAFMAGLGVTRIKSQWAILVAFLIAGLGIYNAYYWIFPKRNKGPLFYLMNPTSFVWGEFETFALAILATMPVSGLIIGYLYLGGQQTNRIGMVVARAGSGLAILIVLLFAACTADLSARLAFRYPPRQLQSQESQFDKLLPIAKRFESSQIFNASPTANEQSLRGELTVFDDDISRIQKILDTQETVPVPYHVVDFWGTTAPSSFRSIARALSRKAQFEFADGQIDQSLSSSVLAIRLREPAAGNMLLISELVALSIEGIGEYSAVEAIPQASRQAIAKALKHVLEVDTRMPPAESIYENEQAVGWQSGNWHRRLRLLCEESSTRDTFESVLEAIKRVQATRKQLIAILALELYRHDTGNYPNSLKSLVPRYLAAVPHDPFSAVAENVPLKYEAINDASNYLLYSVGFNQQDDGGKLHELGYPMPRPDEVGDLNFRLAARLDHLERDTELAKQTDSE